MKQIVVYLTDDDADDRELFEEALANISLNTKIYTFSNGVELMAKLLQKECDLPNVLFIDLNMPMMTGEECIIDIRREPRFDKIPIVVYSTASDSEELYRLQELGANRYLQKPNTFSDLKFKLRDTLNKLHTIDSSFIPENSFLL